MKEINWEIVEHIENQLSQDDEVTDLSIPQKMRLSPAEEFVQSVLKDYTFEQEVFDEETWTTKIISRKADAESLIKQIFDDANRVVTQNNKWDILPDYAARAKLKLELLKWMGILKKDQPDIKINFLSLLFWGKSQ